MPKTISRRSFLLYSAAGLSALAFRSFSPNWDDYPTGDMARVCVHSISVYREPDDTSSIVCQHYRDELLNIYYDVTSEKGPGWNPLWYRVWRGYVHSGRLQRVMVRHNPVLETIPEGGHLAEVTVPFTRTLRFSRTYGWDTSSYRLYSESLHWIMGVEEGPDGEPWYRLKDELLKLEYHAPATHLRPVMPEEYSPISPDVPMEKKKIVVSLSQQSLTAYEDGKEVMNTRISSGVSSRGRNITGIPTETPTGKFRVTSKMPSKHMGDGRLTADLNAYELPGVPWTSFFHTTGVAFHGTYWHNNFGIPMSHGCINMRTEEAKWIFRWTTPVAEANKWENRGYGTLVIVE
jgi:hypothetical protein